jgi:hypothetical protein
VELLAVIIAIRRLSNIGLPQNSASPDLLCELDKARLAEAFHLRESLGDATWPGWSDVDIPVMVCNEAYAFLVGYPDPQDG